MIFPKWASAHRAFKKTALVTAVAATALLAPAFPVEALVATHAATSSSAPAQVTLTQIGSRAEAEANWTYPFSAPPSEQATQLSLYRSVSGVPTPVANVGCVSGCTSYSFSNLVPGATYLVELTFYDNGTWFPDAPKASLTLTSTCPSGVCVSVNTLEPLRPVDHAGQGLLQSVYVGADQKFLPALGVSMHRGVAPQGSNGIDWEQWAAGDSLHWPTTLIVSDAWSIANGGNPPAPTASELPAYEEWLKGYISQVLASGERVDYFEPYNEPDQNYYSPVVALTVTADEMYQLFLASYQVIKSLDPTAQIIGPSMAMFTERPVNGSEAGMDLVDFLNFAAANNIQLAALTWHEISTEQPRKMIEDVAEARRLLQQYPQVGNPKVFINEYGDENTQRTPGWDLNYLSAITDSGVDLAGRTCFQNDCHQPDLDGLLTSDGTQPLPDYWVRAFYGGMSGQMVTTSSSDDSVGAIASYDGAKTVDVSIGRGVGCTDTSRCGTMGAPASPVAESTTVKLPWTSGQVTVIGRDISGANIAAYAEPAPTLSTTLIVPSSGVVTLTVPRFADGDAWTYTIQQVSTSQPSGNTTTPATTPSTGTTPEPQPSCASGSGAPLGSAVGIAAVNIGGCDGYFVADAAGRVAAFGSAAQHGDLTGTRLAAPIIAIDATPDGQGYWLLGADGGVFSFGDAHFYGSTGDIRLNAPVVGMAVTPDNKGYWVVAKDGGVFSFGDARFYGSTGNLHLVAPVDGIAVAPGGDGYWLVAADGGVFTFTSDGFYGSLGGVHLAKPIVGMSSTPDGRGYTLVGSDGGVFSFGDAPFYGSLGSHPPATAVVDLSPAPANNGYYLVTAGGAVYTFGPGTRYFGNA